MSNPVNQYAPNYHDISAMMELRAQANQNPGQNLRKVAEQFESIFVGMMLSSARESMVEGGLFDSSSLRTYQDMFDKQLSVNISTGQKGIGLADLIVKQLEKSQSMDVPVEGSDDV